MSARDAGRRVGAARGAWRVSRFPRPEDLAAGERFAREVLAGMEAQAGRAPHPAIRTVLLETIRTVLLETMTAAYAQGRVDERNRADVSERAAGEA